MQENTNIKFSIKKLVHLFSNKLLKFLIIDPRNEIITATKMDNRSNFVYSIKATFNGIICVVLWTMNITEINMEYIILYIIVSLFTMFTTGGMISKR